ncbi:hypothetical protein [Adlercreutzia mucosicola]|uniref:hypothetical protein n=1 Tax=Adlercreutzia mucosicola TaxID=580026 RepID=UPI002B23F5F2|nr:hypothetical protein [Adlercreutzia mucosicola]MEB1813414.1 hypothetical protein [Adlercreutzia mucosicola]
MAKINKAQALKYKSMRDRYRSERASLVTEHNARMAVLMKMIDEECASHQRKLSYLEREFEFNIQSIADESEVR